MAAPPVGPRHTALACGLDLAQLQRAGCGAEAVVGDRAFRREPRARRHRAEHLVALPAGAEPCARRGVAGAYDARELRERSGDVEMEVVDGELVGVRRFSGL